MGIYQTAKEAADAAINDLAIDEIKVDRESLFAWLAENPPDPDIYDDLDDFLESFEDLGLNPGGDDDDNDDDDDDDDEDGDE